MTLISELFLLKSALVEGIVVYLLVFLISFIKNHLVFAMFQVIVDQVVTLVGRIVAIGREERVQADS